MALTSQQTFPSVTREPPSPTGFTVEGTGTGTSDTFTCDPRDENHLTFNLEFSAEKDGTVTGTYTMSVLQQSGTDIGDFTGELTDGTTDGNTFTLSGTGDLVCFREDVPNNVEISGDCGEGVKFTYRDRQTVGTLDGDVECILT